MAGILSIQFNPKSGDKEYNINRVQEFIIQNTDKNIDMVVYYPLLR